MHTKRDVLSVLLAAVSFWAFAAPTRSMCGAKFIQLTGDKTPYAKRLQYLQTSGTQYIDTLFFPSIDSKIEIDILCLSASSGYSGVAFRGNYYNSSDAFGVGLARTGGGYAVAYFGGKANITAAWMIGKKALISLDRSQISVKFSDGSETKTAVVGATSMSQGSRTLYLLNGNTNTADLRTHANFRLYGCKIYEATELVLDLIPVIDFDGEPCMYDKVSGQFFHNAGTGRFLTNEDA